MTVNCTDVDDAIHLFSQFYVFFFEVLALLQLGTEEVEDPNFFPAIELENGTEVELFDVGVFEQVWDYLLRLLLLLLSLLIKTTTTEVELGAPCASAEELTYSILNRQKF